MRDLYIGVILAFFSASTYALGSIFVQLLGNAIPHFQLNFYRCMGQSILSTLLLVVKGQHPVVTGKEGIILTSVVGISGALQNILIFISVLLIPVGSAGSLLHAGSVIFTLLGVWIFRMERISWKKVIVFSLTVAGISLTLFSLICVNNSCFENGILHQGTICDKSYSNQSKPLKFMDNHSGMSDLNYSLGNGSQFTTDLGNIHNFWISQAFGIILALGSGLAQAGLILGERKVILCDPPVTGPVLSFWVSAAGIPISLGFIPIIEQLKFVSNIRSILLVIGHAATAGVSIILFCLALERAPGVVVSLTFTSDLPIRTLAQYLVIPDFQPPGGGVFDIIGSVVVTIALSLAGVLDLLDKRKTKTEELMPIKTGKLEDK